MSVLNTDQISELLRDLNGWESEGQFITKTFQLENFVAALAFVNEIGKVAEAQDHHPDILIHSWNKVTLTISTHNEGGVTQKDFGLAQAIDTLPKIQ